MNNIFHAHEKINAIAHQIIEDHSSDESVVGIFVAGSTVKGGRDMFSDVDINFVVKDAADFELKLIKHLKKLHNVIFYFNPPFLKNILVFYLDGGYKFDFGIYTPENNLSGFRQKKTKIIIDKLGTLENQIKLNINKKLNKDTANQYLYLAIADLIAIRREVCRKELFEARANLDDARFHLAIYLNLTNQHYYFGYDKFLEFSNKKCEKLWRESLKNNSEFEDILKASKKLLLIIKEIKEIDLPVLELISTKLFSTYNHREN